MIKFCFLRKSIVYAKRRTCAIVPPTIEPEPIHMTRRATRTRKQTKEINTTKQQPRKRKQSISDDGNNNTVALRKKKAVPPLQQNLVQRKQESKRQKVCLCQFQQLKG